MVHSEKQTQFPSVPEETEHSEEYLFNVSKAVEAITHPDHPSLAIGKESAQQLSNLVANLAQQPNSIVAVVRAYNKPNITSVIENMQQLKSAMPNLAGISIVVNTDPENGDKDQLTLRAVEDLAARQNADSDSNSLSVVGLGIEQGYSWTAGLNAVPALLIQAEKQLGTALDTGIMYYSTDVEIENDELKKLAEAYKEYELGIGAVRIDSNPHGLITADTIPPQSEVLEYFKNPDEYKARYEDDVRWQRPTALQILAHSRNTLSIVSLEVLKSLGGMDPACNTAGGMEDAQFWVRLAQDRPDQVAASLSVESARYTDDAWDRMANSKARIALNDVMLGEGQMRKLNAEALARFSNAAYLLDTESFDAGLRVPAERQDYLF